MTWQLVLDDSFTHADTTPGAAGSTTGVPTTPVTGAANSWTDIAGGIYRISSNTVFAHSVAGGGAYASQLLLRPANEIVGASQRIVATFIYNNPVSLILRYVNPSVFYLLEMRSNALTFYVCNNSGATQIGLGTFSELTPGNKYTLDFSAVGKNPTALSAVLTDITSTSVVQIVSTNCSDSSSGTQVDSSSYGLTCYLNDYQFSHVQAYSDNGSGITPVPGKFSVSSTSSSINITASAQTSIVSNSFYRGLAPNFIANSNALLGTQPSATYVDASAVIGNQYFYKVIAKDSSSNVYNVLPSGFDGAVTSEAYSLPGSLPGQAIAEVFIGDSITFGANADPGVGPCGPAVANLANAYGKRTVLYSNQGHSGSATPNWVSGSFLQGAKDAMTTLLAQLPGAQAVFSVMLGTNDSAGGISVSSYQANMQQIISSLKSSFTNCKIILNASPWFSTNSHNAGIYDAVAQALLLSYRPALNTLVSLNTGCFLGDTNSFEFMSRNYLTDMVPESGQNGTFYLHPSHQGNLDLGTLWAEAAAVALGYAAGGSSGQGAVNTGSGFGLTPTGQVVALL